MIFIELISTFPLILTSFLIFDLSKLNSVHVRYTSTQCEVWRNNNNIYYPRYQKVKFVTTVYKKNTSTVLNLYKLCANTRP